MQNANDERVKKILYKSKKRNIAILYTVTIIVWLLIVVWQVVSNRMDIGGVIDNIGGNLLGILPPILIFNIMYEYLSRDVSAIEVSKQITDALMSDESTLKLFDEATRKKFIECTINSIVDDKDATAMLFCNEKNYLENNAMLKLYSTFQYDFTLTPLVRLKSELFNDADSYFYMQEHLVYKLKNIGRGIAEGIGASFSVEFVFNNEELDKALNDGITAVRNDCIFREGLYMTAKDYEAVRGMSGTELDRFVKDVFKFEVQIDYVRAQITACHIQGNKLIIDFTLQRVNMGREQLVDILFYIPWMWSKPVFVKLIHPAKAPKISFNYREEEMDVDMYPFLGASKEGTFEKSAHKNAGFYNIDVYDDWVYPGSGVFFQISKLM